MLIKEINLNDNLILSFEPLGKRVRIIISAHGEELGCRKETIKELLHFLTIEEARIFKGRLQLHKSGDLVTIVLKNEPVGVIAATHFMAILNNL